MSDVQLDITERSNNDIQTSAEPSTEGPDRTDDSELKKTSEPKLKPYVNRDRHKTGGPPREKLSVDELSERMEHIREKNERIKQRRMAVQADEEAFQHSQEEERRKQTQNKLLQESINRNREANAQRKMAKVSNREWDNGKQRNQRKWKTGRSSMSADDIQESSGNQTYNREETKQLSNDEDKAEATKIV